MTGSEHSLANIPFLAPLDEPARKSLEQRARWLRHKPSETIIDRESDSRDVYFSLSGREVTFDEMDVSFPPKTGPLFLETEGGCDGSETLFG